jgi:hypothetical protein
METDQKLEDAVLKRMLNTPHKPHKEKKAADDAKNPNWRPSKG